MAKIENYSRDLPFSYALGPFVALQALNARPECARRLLLHPAGEKNDGVALLRAQCEALGVREEFAERALARISGKDNCFAALMFDKYASPLDASAPHAVFCHITDAGNLGSCLRACLGFGVRDVAIIRPAADIFEPHTLRSSMGAFFKMRVAEFDTFDDYRAPRPERRLYPFMLKGSVPLEEAARERESPYSLVFGNEQRGLPDEFASFGRAVRIPQSADIDSLNLAAAAAIGLYAFRRADMEV